MATTSAEAWRIAQRAHAGQVDHDGQPHIEHVIRVVQTVPLRLERLAILHDVVEDSDEDIGNALDPTERKALTLLTRVDGQSYDEYVMAIVNAQGPEGVMARAVKEADMVDNLRRSLAFDHGLTKRYRRHLPKLITAVARDFRLGLR